MLGQLSWQVESHSSLHLPAGDGMLLVVVSQSEGLSSIYFKDVIHKEFMMLIA